MKELIDLFAKLVIGTFTFIGPSFTLFISLFSRQLYKANATYKSRLQNLVILDGNNKELEKLLNQNKKDTNLLNPKRQMQRLFIPLLLAIIGIGFYYFQHSHYWTYKKESVRIITIFLSITLFLYCLFVLWQVFCMIIKAKLEEEEEKEQSKISLKPI